MITARKVIQVPIGDELLRSVDELSRRRGQTRSEFIREACRRYLRQLEQEELDRAYEEGYRRQPENPALGQAQLALVGQVLEEEPW